jgi:hypothetical protein
MFGSHYSYLDRALKERRFVEESRTTKEAQLRYARELIADLINRHIYVELAAAAAESNEEKQPDLLLALKVFTEDINEARMRARRAGLVYEEPVGWVNVYGGTEFNARLEDETGDDLLVPEVISEIRRESMGRTDPPITKVTEQLAATYRRAELADAVRRVRQMELGPDLDEKMEAVLHVFEVTNYVPDEMPR